MPVFLYSLPGKGISSRLCTGQQGLSGEPPKSTQLSFRSLKKTQRLLFVHAHSASPYDDCAVLVTLPG